MEVKNMSLKFRMYYYFRRILTNISPLLNTKVVSFIERKKWLNLTSPETFEEKLSWLKLNTYSNNKLVTQCADKLAVREYVKECGFEDLLNEVYGVWETELDIPWEEFPERFALKCNHGSGFNIICKNKEKLNIEESKRKLKKWMKYDQWKNYSELNYKHIEKKIYIEKYIETDQGFFPNDYKIYCFNGVPKAILVISNRDDKTSAIFMSTEWEFISFPSKYKGEVELPIKPQSLEKMLDVAATLSTPFPFVRVDLYQTNEGPLFGEMTFTPAAGLFVSKTDINGKTMGEMLRIPTNKSNK